MPKRQPKPRPKAKFEDLDRGKQRFLRTLTEIERDYYLQVYYHEMHPELHRGPRRGRTGRLTGCYTLPLGLKTTPERREILESLHLKNYIKMTEEEYRCACGQEEAETAKQYLADKLARARTKTKRKPASGKGTNTGNSPRSGPEA